MTATIKTMFLIAAGLLFAPAAMAGTEVVDEVAAILDSHAVDLDPTVKGDTIVVEGEVEDYSKADYAIADLARLPGVKTIINRVRIS